MTKKRQIGELIYIPSEVTLVPYHAENNLIKIRKPSVGIIEKKYFDDYYVIFFEGQKYLIKQKDMYDL